MSLMFEIAGRQIGNNNPPYIIAELSGNHNGKLEHAFEIMRAAKTAGADAIKIQTYTADTMTIDFEGPGFVVDLPLWKNRKLYDLYEEASTPWEWHEVLFAMAKKLDLTIFSSPFDKSAVDFLENLGTPAYKIASPEIVDIPLIEYVASTGKPMIMSTGMANIEEIEDAVSAAQKAGCKQLSILHCVSAYPTPPQDANLSNIMELRRKFNLVTGLSDHTLGVVVPIAAVSMGASIIEKHFTLSRSEGGVDSAFSIEPEELEFLVSSCKEAQDATGEVKIGPKESELRGLNYRRSLYIVEDIAAGEILTIDNVRAIRPGFGLKPKFYNEIIGKKALQDIKRGTPVSWKLIG